MAESEKKHPVRLIKILACIQVACGLFAILWQIVNMSIHDLVGIAGAGLWCGTTFFIAGMAGIFASRGIQACGVISWLAFSGFAMIFGFTLLGISMVGVFLEIASPENGFDTESSTPYPNREVKLSIDVILALCALTAAVVSIMAMVVATKDLCGRKKVPYETMSNDAGDIAVSAMADQNYQN